MNTLTQSAINLLKQMIATESFSGNEKNVSDIVVNFLKDNGHEPEQIGNNIIARCKDFAEGRATLMLFSQSVRVVGDVRVFSEISFLIFNVCSYCILGFHFSSFPQYPYTHVQANTLNRFRF